MARWVRILDEDGYINAKIAADVGGSNATQTVAEAEELDTTQMAPDERELIRLQKQAKHDQGSVETGQLQPIDDQSNDNCDDRQPQASSRSLDEELQRLRALASSIKLKLAGIETAHDALTSILSEYGVDLNDRHVMACVLDDLCEYDELVDDKMDDLVEECSLVEFMGYSAVVNELDQAKRDYFNAAAYVMMAAIAPVGSDVSEECYDRAIDILDRLTDFAKNIHDEVMPDDRSVKEYEKLLAAKSAVLLYVVTGYEADVLRQRLTRYDQRAAELEKAINKSQ